MIQFNKTAFDSSLNSMKMIYEKNEKMRNTFRDQTTWSPEEGKKVIKDWLSAYSTGSEDFKKSVNESYTRVEMYLDNL